jgi:ABC-2 type transport system permease protein
MFFDLVRLEILKVLISKRLILVILTILIISVGTAVDQKDMENGLNGGSLEERKKSYYEQLEKLPPQIAALEQVPDLAPEQKNNLYEMKKGLEFMQLQGEPKKLDFNAFTFSIELYQQIAVFFLPLLVLLIAGDLISTDFDLGIIKLVFSSPTGRLKFYAVKILSGMLYVLLMIIMSGLIAFLVGGLFFGFEGWNQPFRNSLKLVGVSNIQFLIMEMGLVTFGMTVVLLMGILLSTLFNSAVIPIVISMAVSFGGFLALNEGGHLPFVKYLFTTHVNLLTNLLAGYVPKSNGTPVIPENLNFSLGVLGVYALIFALSSVIVFSQRKAPA